MLSIIACISLITLLHIYFPIVNVENVQVWEKIIRGTLDLFHS